MQRAIVLEIDEEVLTESVSGAQGRAVQQRRTYIEAALRTRHVEHLALERAVNAASLAVDDVSLGHGGSVAAFGRPRSPGRRGSQDRVPPAPFDVA